MTNKNTDMDEEILFENNYIVSKSRFMEWGKENAFSGKCLGFTIYWMIFAVVFVAKHINEFDTIAQKFARKCCNGSCQFPYELEIVFLENNFLENSFFEKSLPVNVQGRFFVFSEKLISAKRNTHKSLIRSIRCFCFFASRDCIFFMVSISSILNPSSV